MARLATKKAKPNGQFRVTSAEVMTHMRGMAVGELPGVGWSLREKLKADGVTTVDDLRRCVLLRVSGFRLAHVMPDTLVWLECSVTLDQLRRRYGKVGEMLWQGCRGLDDRALSIAPKRKSVGAEVGSLGVSHGVMLSKSHSLGPFVRTFRFYHAPHSLMHAVELGCPLPHGGATKGVHVAAVGRSERADAQRRGDGAQDDVENEAPAPRCRTAWKNTWVWTLPQF